MTRLLFVLSNDYGELSNARYFIHNEPFDSLFLLPPRLYAANAGHLSIRHELYESPADVLRAVDRERPAIVMLFSGYLFTLNNLLDERGLADLITGLRGRGCRIVTSDPFLGILRRIDHSTFSDRHPQKHVLTEHFARLNSLLRELPHLYLVPVNSVGSLSFFNDAMLGSPRDELVPPGHHIDPDRPQWLFVLSLEDYSGQVSAMGRARFDRLVIDRMRDAIRAGAQPILIAPETAIESIEKEGGTIPEAVLLSFCGHDLFRALAGSSQYAFYWNVLSNSIAARVANHRPVFFFDRGHMVRSIPALHEAALAAYYQGAELPFLDPAAPLSISKLSELAARQDTAFEPARVAFRQSPSSAEVVARLMQSSSNGGSA